jgi:hypothetical protein
VPTVQFRGLGWLAFAAWPLIIVLAAPVIAVSNLGTGLIAGCLLTAAAVYLLGVLLNSKATARGRAFHDRHEFNGDPLQDSARFYLFLALLVLIAGVVVQFRRGEGWQVFALDLPSLVTLALAVVIASRARWWTRLKRFRQIADQHGWHLTTDMKGIRGWSAEFRGLCAAIPFTTAIDRDGLRCTVQLATAVPDIQVGPSLIRPRSGVYDINGIAVGVGAYRDERSGRAVARAVAFALEVVTPDVAALTRRCDLRGWRTQGDQLSYMWHGWATNTAVIDIVDALTTVAAAVPAHVLGRHALTEHELTERNHVSARYQAPTRSRRFRSAAS